MSKQGKKRFFSIRSRLFLQVGAIILTAILLILALNRWCLPFIYTYNVHRNMRSVAAQIDELDQTSPLYYNHLALLEKQNGITIDVYLADGTPLYYGEIPAESAGGKVEITRRTENTDGSFFEIQTNTKTGTQYIVYGTGLAFGGAVELYAQKSTVDSYANLTINAMLLTSIITLLCALIGIYLYSRKFTKPLIKMSEVTGGMVKLDFSKKCEVKSHDEIGNLAQSINELSDSLRTTLADLKEKNARLQQDIEKEQNLDKIRKDFISNVSHELKTPIAIIQGYAEGAKLMLEGDTPAQAAGYCEIITAETAKMNTLVLQLLELSMYESGNVTLSESEIDLYRAAADYAEENSMRFAEKGITFCNRIPPHTIGVGDSVKIQMILNNYISNARSHAGGEKIIRVSAAESPESPDSLRVYVYNSGSRIADEDIDKIWMSFYRADKAHSREDGRFGLGLSIVSAIQKLHKQGCGAENTADGVCFWFDIKKIKRG